MLERIGRFLCQRGFHQLEKEPSRQYAVRRDPKSPSKCYRPGEKRCLREGCGATVAVFQSGFHNLMGAKWRVVAHVYNTGPRTPPHYPEIW